MKRSGPIPVEKMVEVGNAHSADFEDVAPTTRRRGSLALAQLPAASLSRSMLKKSLGPLGFWTFQAVSIEPSS